MAGELPRFSGGLLERFDEFQERLEAFVRLRPQPVSEQQKWDLLLLSLTPGSAACEALKHAPTRCGSFEEGLALLSGIFANPTFKDLARTALTNALKFRRFRDAEHPHELVSRLLDDVDRYGRALQLDDAKLRDALLR